MWFGLTVLYITVGGKWKNCQLKKGGKLTNKINISH